jgi:hypothetical protein
VKKPIILTAGKDVVAETVLTALILAYIASILMNVFDLLISYLIEFLLIYFIVAKHAYYELLISIHENSSDLNGVFDFENLELDGHVLSHFFEEVY